MNKTKLEELLASAVHAGAEVLHLQAGKPPALRVQGNLVSGADARIRAEDLTDLVRDFLFGDHRARLARGEEVEVLYTSQQGVRFRMLIQEQENGLALVLRRLPTEVPKLQDLGLPDLVGGFASFRSGIVLVVGFAGSGRSSTLAGLVDRINHDSALHIVTIESPIEFLHPQGHSLVVQREVGMQTANQADGVRDAVREGADVVVVGDIPDESAFNAVLEAAEAGVLVLAATNGSSVVGGLAGLFDRVAEKRRRVARSRLAATLKVSLSQTLLQKSHGNGRVPLVEILIANTQVAEALRKDALTELPAIMQKARGLGMQTVDVALKNLLARNLISVEEALYHAVDRDWVLARSAGRR